MIPISQAFPGAVRPGTFLNGCGRWQRWTGLAALCLAFGACAPDGTPQPPPEPRPGNSSGLSTPAAERPTTDDVATHVAADPKAPMVLARVDNGFHPVPIPLAGDFGFLVVNEGNEDHPSALIAVGLRRDSAVMTCRSIPEFEAALRRIPAGSTVHRHDRCLRPASAGLSEDFLAGIEAALRHSGLTVAPDTVTWCLCGR